jgi:hypothetical protein
LSICPFSKDMAISFPGSCRHVRSSSGDRWSGSRISVWIRGPPLVHPGFPTSGLRLHGSHRRLHGPCRAEDARASPRSSDAPAQLTMHTLHAVAEVSLTDGRIKARAQVSEEHQVRVVPVPSTLERTNAVQPSDIKRGHRLRLGRPLLPRPDSKS